VSEPVVTDDPAVEALVIREGAAQDVISDQLVAALLALWAGFTAFYAGEAVATLGTQMARLVVAAQRSAGRLTEAHLRMQIRRMGFELPQGTIVDLPRDLRLGAETADVYQRPVREVRYLESVEDVPRDEAVETARERLEKLALTDLQLARATSAQQVFYRFPQATGWRRVIHPELGNVCGLCIAAADRVYQRIERLALHPGCVLEGTEVAAADVRALTRRRYAGPVVVLRTRSGQELRVTPNHPILTDHGWVRADGLRQGDRVVRHDGFQRVGGGCPDKLQRPTRVEDLWRSLTVSSGLLPRSMPLAAEDFHGDVTGKGEVDVVLVDRHLAPVGNVSFFEPCRELSLVGAHGRRGSLAAASPIEQFFVTSGASLGRSVSALQELKALIRAELAVANTSSLGPVANRYFSAPETSGDGGAGYAEVGRQLLDRLAGDMEFDDLVEIDVIAWSGHVYNLETGEGWYTGSSIAVSNCKCTILPVIGGMDPGGQLNADDLAKLYEAAGGTGTRQLSATRWEIKHNGELGEVLTPAQVRMRNASQVQNQLSDRAAEMRKRQLQKQIEEMRPKAARSQWHKDRMEQLQALLDAA
jgi:hypothetical protein